MRGFHGNIEEATLGNTNFRQVMYTAEHTQLVLMCLKPGEEIGAEVHGENDQFLRFEAGSGRVTVDDNSYDVTHGSAVIVPAGAKHNVVNTSDAEDLKLYTLYAPPHHKDAIVHATREEAEQNDEDFDGVTTES